MFNYLEKHRTYRKNVLAIKCVLHFSLQFMFETFFPLNKYLGTHAACDSKVEVYCVTTEGIVQSVSMPAALTLFSYNRISLLIAVKRLLQLYPSTTFKHA
jgi:hypothetical protein